MPDNSKKRILDAIQLLLRPVAKIFVRYGLGFNEFSEVAKLAFVDVATSDFGIRGRPTNISRVAVMTGLTRKEVKRLRTRLAEGEISLGIKTTPMAQVIHRWCSEKDFVDERSGPLPLPFSGDGVSFSSLVKRFGGDVPPGAMRTELKRVGCITESENGTLRVIRRSVIPVDRSDNLVTTLVHGAYPLLSTIAENSGVSAEEADLAQFTAYSTHIRKEDLPKLREISYDRLLNTVEKFDDLFVAYESLDETEGDDPPSLVAVGVFYFEERDDNANYEW